MSHQIQLDDVVGATLLLKQRACPTALWSTGAMKDADADTVTGGGGVAIRAENRGNLSRGIF